MPGSIFKAEKLKAAIAANGKQAVTIANEINSDLILLDIMMPGINGFEVCKNIKSLLITKIIPVIFLTAKVENEEIIEGFKMGAVDYITKYFNSYVINISDYSQKLI